MDLIDLKFVMHVVTSYSVVRLVLCDVTSCYVVLHMLHSLGVDATWDETV